MTSKISLYKLVREDLRHRIWMIALSCLGSFLTCPVMFLFVMQNGGPRRLATDAYSAMSNYLVEWHMYGQTFILFFGAIIVAVGGFRYLFSKQQIDMYHSAPVTRTRMFFVQFIGGFLIWLVPFLIGQLSVWALSLRYLLACDNSAYVLRFTGDLLLCIVFLCLRFLSVYCLCLTAVMISGNISPALINIGILGLVAICFYGLMFGMCSLFFESYVPEVPTVYLHLSLALSPLTSAWIVEQSYTWSYPQWFVVFLAVLVCNLLLSWRLYVHRPSELAERGVRNPWFHTPLRITTSFLLGMVGAVFFLSLVDDETSIGWPIFGALLFSILSFGVLDTVYNRNFRCFFAHKRQMLITAIAACAVFFIFRYDVFGYDTYVPDREDILSASVYFNDFSDEGAGYQPDGSGGVYLVGRGIYSPAFENYVSTDADAIYALLRQGVDADEYGYDLVIRVNLRNGTHYYRRYSLTAGSDTDVKELIRPFVESKEYLDSCYPLSHGYLGLPGCISITPTDALIGRRYDRADPVYDDIALTAIETEDSNAIRRLLDAYSQDFAQHNTLEELASYVSVARLELRYSSDNSYTRSLELDIPESYEQTLSILRELYPAYSWGKEDLMTPLSVSIGIFKTLDQQALYSYFGIEGYPDYDTLAEELSDGYKIFYENGRPYYAASHQDTDYSYYKLLLTDDREIAEFLSVCHVGDDNMMYVTRQAENGMRCSEPLSDEYIYAGYWYTKLGARVNLYVKKGEMPADLIEEFYPDQGHNSY